MPQALSIHEAFRGRHVLLTGVTGFLGKVWLAMLLEHVPDVGRLTVIVRGRRGEDAVQRFRRIVERSPAFRPLRERHGARLHSWLDDRVRVVEGDCGRPLAGLDRATAAHVCASVNVVAHFAGTTDFMPDPRDALAANVRGAQHAADLAACCSGRRLVHVSTSFVAGKTSGTVAEALTPGIGPNGARFDPDAEANELARSCEHLRSRRARTDAARERAEELGWPNLYTYTKALAEHLLSRRDDIRLTVLRPSIVECARTFPFPGWNEGINTSGPLVWLFSTSFRHFPSRARHHFDVVPVDTVARGVTLATAAALKDRAADVYHLASGDTNPLTFGRAIELTNLGVRRMHAKPDARRLERWVLRHLDVVPIDLDDAPWTGPTRLVRAAGRARELVRRVDPAREMPPSAYARWGKSVEKHVSRLGRRLRRAEVNFSRVEAMLELYRPFIHDHDYVFRTDRIRALSAALPADERRTFEYDAAEVDWRRYWLEVEVPGLERWCLPLMRGESPQQDAPASSGHDAPLSPSGRPQREEASDRPAEDDAPAAASPVSGMSP